MCRGLLGADSDLYIRNNRGAAFSKSDCIIICGVPFDFRSGYGLTIPLQTFVVAVNRDEHDLHLNRDMKFWMSPAVSVLGDPCSFLIDLARGLSSEHSPPSQWGEWQRNWVDQDKKKNDANSELASQKTQFINPVKLCQEIDKYLADDSILVGDGGDFVATVAYNVRARQPLSWLDPGLYGTLGIGAGFAIASKLVKPNSEVWLFWGDGASGYSLIEFDTLRRQGLAVIAVIGNDACWMQIWRGQVDIFNDETGCTLEYTNYHEVAKALGCEGFEIDSEDQIGPVVKQAKALAAAGKSVLINAKLGKTEFRKGSMSF
jgi:thiamine pyrophosphate-dependent acetolactate synthase large subunit-like protein